MHPLQLSVYRRKCSSQDGRLTRDPKPTIQNIFWQPLHMYSRTNMFVLVAMIQKLSSTCVQTLGLGSYVVMAELGQG